MDAMNFPQAKVEVSTMPIKRQGVTYMTVSELADELDVHRNSVIYWIKTGKVNAVRIGLAEKVRSTSQCQKSNESKRSLLARNSLGD